VVVAFVGAFLLLIVAVGGVGMLLMMGAIAWYAVKAKSLSRPVATQRVCEACGYPGRGLVSERCPECGGRFIDVPADRARLRLEALDAAKGFWLALLAIGLAAGLLAAIVLIA
jgi:hypothetical protein